MLKHILGNRDNRRVAVIVNDMSEVNIDATPVKNKVQLQHCREKRVEMSNGCIRCISTSAGYGRKLHNCPAIKSGSMI